MINIVILDVRLQLPPKRLKQAGPLTVEAFGSVHACGTDPGEGMGYAGVKLLAGERPARILLKTKPDTWITIRGRLWSDHVYVDEILSRFDG